MQELKFEGIDNHNRPVFKSKDNKRYGSVTELFSYHETVDDVLKKVTPFDMCWFGNTFNCEPMGGSISFEFKLVKEFTK